MRMSRPCTTFELQRRGLWQAVSDLHGTDLKEKVEVLSQFIDKAPAASAVKDCPATSEHAFAKFDHIFRQRCAEDSLRFTTDAPTLADFYCEAGARGHGFQDFQRRAYDLGADALARQDSDEEQVRATRLRDRRCPSRHSVQRPTRSMSD